MMEAELRNHPDLDWITMILIVALILLVVSKILYYSRFMNFMILPFNNKYVFMYNKKGRLANGFQLFTTVFQLLNFSLFIYLGLRILTSDIPFPPHYFLIIFGSITAFTILKIGLQLGNGFLFNSHHIIADFIFKKLSYLNYSSLVMLMANVLLVYVFPASKTVLFIGLFLILTINVIGWITLLKNHQKFIASRLFYFILYLCALEIAPLVIISKLLNA